MALFRRQFRVRIPPTSADFSQLCPFGSKSPARAATLDPIRLTRAGFSPPRGRRAASLCLVEKSTLGRSVAGRRGVSGAVSKTTRQHEFLATSDSHSGSRQLRLDGGDQYVDNLADRDQPSAPARLPAWARRISTLSPPVRQRSTASSSCGTSRFSGILLQ